MSLLGAKGATLKKSGTAVRREAAVGHEHVDMRMEVEQLSRGLQEASRARGHVGAVKVISWKQ